MFQWFHACWMLKLSLEQWSVVVLNPDTNQSARSVCLFSDEFSLLVFQNNQRSHNSLSNRRTKHHTYVNNNQRNIYRHTENNRNRNKQAKKRILISGIFILTSLFLQLYFCSVTQQTENFKSLNEIVTLEVQNQTLRD